MPTRLLIACWLALWATHAPLDSDADGLPDAVERQQTSLTSPVLADTDGDGISDGIEVHSRTNPLDPDTDGDWLPDGLEDTNRNGRVDLGETNPRLLDSDRDDLADGAEDANRDGLVSAAETDPRRADSDDDGLADGVELGDAGTNPRDVDTDSDGVRDGLEDANQNGGVDDDETNPRVSDSDDDGPPDGLEDANQNGRVDARPTNQFTRTAPGAAFVTTHPGQFITTAWNSSGPPSTDTSGQAKNYVLYEGHVKGAVSFPWANLVVDVGNNNWKYKPKAELEQLFTAAGYRPEDKASKVIVSQCRTNFEVQVNGFAARLILGYPTVHFDGSLIEYFSLVSNHPNADFNLRPTDPAWRFRTDTAERSQKYTASTNAEAPSTTEDDSGVTAYNLPNGTGAADRKVAQAVVNKNATTTRKAIDEDREYKRVLPTTLR